MQGAGEPAVDTELKFSWFWIGEGEEGGLEDILKDKVGELAHQLAGHMFSWWGALSLLCSAARPAIAFKLDV